MIPIAGSSISASEHQHLERKVGEIAERIRDQGRKRRLTAEILKSAKDDFEIPIDDEKRDIIETSLVYPVENMDLEDIVVAGVDGGILNKPLHGLDLILVRSVVAIFSYENGNLLGADYHPSEMPVPRLVNVHEPLDSRELDTLVGLERQFSEMSKAKEAVEERDIDALLLDGSIVPQYVRNGAGGRTRELYEDLIESYKELYRTCTEKGILLLGAVKDSRSSRLANIFQKKIFPKLIEDEALSRDEITSFNENKNVLLVSRDTAFLDYLLEAGERTFTFSYAKAPANLLEDLGDWKKQIYAFYVKPVPYDRPVRVEFLSNQDEATETVERAASLVSSLSAGHDACALPSVLIEADARAALAEEEISILRDNISDRLEPSTMFDLRRERRPF